MLLLIVQQSTPKAKLGRTGRAKQNTRISTGNFGSGAARVKGAANQG